VIKTLANQVTAGKPTQIGCVHRVVMLPASNRSCEATQLCESIGCMSLF
jgi:hypothetical protein